MSFNPLSWIRELFQIRKLRQDEEDRRRKKSGIVTDISTEDIEKYDSELRELKRKIESEVLNYLGRTIKMPKDTESKELLPSLGYKYIFKITDQSLKNMKSARFPDDVISKLKKIKNRAFHVEYFVRILVSTIGLEQTEIYWLLIFEYAFFYIDSIDSW